MAVNFLGLLGITICFFPFCSGFIIFIIPPVIYVANQTRKKKPMNSYTRRTIIAAEKRTLVLLYCFPLLLPIIIGPSCYQLPHPFASDDYPYFFS